MIIYYIYTEQGYKSLLSLNKECIFENIPLVVVKMKVVNMKFPHITASKNFIIYIQ